jgi:hypothetical protein
VHDGSFGFLAQSTAGGGVGVAVGVGGGLCVQLPLQFAPDPGVRAFVTSGALVFVLDGPDDVLVFGGLVTNFFLALNLSLFLKKWFF